MSPKGSRLDETFARLLARRQARNQLRTLTTVPPGDVDFSSNAYLSLSAQPAVQRAFLARLHAAASVLPDSTAPTLTGTSTNASPITKTSDNGTPTTPVINTTAANTTTNTTTTLNQHSPHSSHPISKPQTHLPSQPSNHQLLGSGGSRLLDGNSPRAETLERSLARFHNAPAALLFNSALDANVGLFACVPQPGDVVVHDELIHASVHDGMRLSRVGGGNLRAFRHSCVWKGSESGRGEDGGGGVVGGGGALGVGGEGVLTGRGEGKGGDSGARKQLPPLEAVLESLLQGADGHHFRSGARNVFVAVEGVYSMDGDVAPLRDIVDCVERMLPQGNGYIIVDEAHSVGLFGERGRGLVCELGLEDRVWARVLGFGKAMGCSGGLVLCSQTTRAYLVNYARTLIYTTAMAFPSLASIETAYEFLMTGQAEPLLEHLRFLIRETHRLLLALCSRQRPSAGLLSASEAEPQSPVIPVFTSRPRSLARYCQQRGYMVRPIVAPTVPKGKERIRVCLHAGNMLPEVEGLIRVMEAWVAECTAEPVGRYPQDALSQGSLALAEVRATEKAKL